MARRSPDASPAVMGEIRPIISSVSRDIDLATSALRQGQTHESWQRILSAYGQVSFALGLLEETLRIGIGDDALEEIETGLVTIHGRLQATVLNGVAGRRPDLGWTVSRRSALPNPR